MIRHLLGRTVLALSVGALSAAACSDDESPGAPAAPGGGVDAGATGTDGGAENVGGATASRAGSSGNTTGGAPDANAGAASNEAGAVSGGMATGGSKEPGGLGGEGGGEPEPLPPDLVSLSGGPWPDSFSGSCANATKSVVCPQTAGAFFGQDGTYRINVPTYQATATTLKDSVTSLVWQLELEATPRTQADAVAYCDGLTLANQSDWRLPTRLEYVSVLDEGVPNGARMPPDVPSQDLGSTWTSSGSGLDATQFFTLNEQSGAWNLGTASTAYAVRCVRGPAFSGARTASTDVVDDAMTKLVWQSTSLDDALVTWEAALDYCEDLTHAGKDDWRLPSIKELATLVDESASASPVLYADLGGAAAQYWSSTPSPAVGGDTTLAFVLETTLGISPSLKVTGASAAARCVRSAD